MTQAAALNANEEGVVVEDTITMGTDLSCAGLGKLF